MSNNKSEEIAFCMIPSKNKNGEIIIYPHPLFICPEEIIPHCRILKGKFNEDRTGMIPSDEGDVKKIEEHIRLLKTYEDKLQAIYRDDMQSE